MTKTMSSNASCVILVPLFGQITPRCDDALRELERRGYPVRRVRGFSAIDQGRNQMASDALHDGFAETMWIDPDIVFAPEAVERLRSHGLPLAAGIYPQPGGRSLACHLLPGTEKLVFGEQGGLVEIKYTAAGFMHIRRAAYEMIRDRLGLPLCNTRFGRGMWPFFMPIAVEHGDQGTGDRGQESGSGGRGFGGGSREVQVTASAATQPRHRYLTEDFAFCHRARQAGLKVTADTTIRLWRMGTYNYGWEDAGSDPERFDTYHFHVE